MLSLPKQLAYAKLIVYKIMFNSYYDFVIDYFQDEDGLFTATVAALPGCVASGKTLTEAYKNIKSAIESCVEVRKKENMPIAKNIYDGKNTYRLELAV